MVFCPLTFSDSNAPTACLSFAQHLWLIVSSSGLVIRERSLPLRVQSILHGFMWNMAPSSGTTSTLKILARLGSLFSAVDNCTSILAYPVCPVLIVVCESSRSSPMSGRIASFDLVNEVFHLRAIFRPELPNVNMIHQVLTTLFIVTDGSHEHWVLEWGEDLIFQQAFSGSSGPYVPLLGIMLLSLLGLHNRFLLRLEHLSHSVEGGADCPVLST